MKILLTGADGFVGRHLSRTLVARHEVYAVTRRDITDSPDVTDIPGVHRVHADLVADGWEAALPASIDAVIALAQAREYRSFPDGAEAMFDVNVRSVHRLLAWARQASATRVILASSANVYRRSDRPLTEDDPVAPESFYARTKSMAEMLLQSYAPFMHGIGLRLFTPYGPGQSGTLIPALIDRVRTGRPIQLQAGTGLHLSPLYIDDLCRVIETLIDAPAADPGYDLFNVGGPDAVSIRDVTRTIADLLGAAPNLDVIDGPAPLGWIADTRRLRSRYSFEPFTPVHQGLAHVVETEMAETHVSPS